MSDKEQVCIICEQGDMGLFGDPLSEADQQKLLKENKNDTKNADEK